MSSPSLIVLGRDPSTTHRLNACAYQQSALLSFEGYQYVAFYTSTTSPHTGTTTTPPRNVTLGRRASKSTSFNLITFTDYNQTTDDGHNTISLGICEGDGTLHISFDHHCDTLKYRVSRPGFLREQREESWNIDSFSEIRNSLNRDGNALEEISYPRFISADSGMFFECRVGKYVQSNSVLSHNVRPKAQLTLLFRLRAGAGSNILYHYDPQSHLFSFLGTYLIGRACNPYSNGLSYTSHNQSMLAVTWTNRHFIEYTGSNDPNSTAHKAQAGPNGPENNEGLYSAYSLDIGKTWFSAEPAAAESIASLKSEEENSGMDSRNEKLKVKNIPRNSGIMNQESQFLDSKGGIHVLNRENTSGEERWIHYFAASVSDQWDEVSLPLKRVTETGPRGKVVLDPYGEMVYFILPDNLATGIFVLRARRKGDGDGFGGYEVIWHGREFGGEPLVDEVRLRQDSVLSFMCLRIADGGGRDVVVLEFGLEELKTAAAIEVHL